MAAVAGNAADLPTSKRAKFGEEACDWDAATFVVEQGVDNDGGRRRRPRQDDREKGQMSEIVQLIIQIVTGAIGGNVVGGAAKNISLGTTGNSIVGAVGGLILGQVLSHLGMGGAADVAGAAGAAPAVAGGPDIGAIIAQIIGGGAGGAILTAIAGAIKKQMS